jgi:predicted nucleotidyltransferase
MSDAGIHKAPVEEFMKRVKERKITGVESICLFGSVARGEDRGRDSDEDLFVVFADDTDKRAKGDELRDLAYGVMIDHDIAISIHTQERSNFEEQQDHSFVRRVLNEGIAYV